MSHEKFKPDDIFINTIKTHPEVNFFIYDSEVFYNGIDNQTGEITQVLSVPKGHLSLYELNLDRVSSFTTATATDSSIVFPDKTKFSTMLGKSNSLNAGYVPPTTLSYPLSASITRINTAASTVTIDGVDFDINAHISALYVPAQKYVCYSPKYDFNKGKEYATGLTSSAANLINIPSIYYGSTIKPGTTKLQYYINGTLIAECFDKGHNGVLIQTSGSGTGTAVGLVMFDEGIILLTGSHSLGSTGIYYQGPSGPATDDSWMYFGAGANDITHDSSINKASFNINFLGTSNVSTMTLFCHAEKGKYNYSNNPTSIDSTVDATTFFSSSFTYSEPRLSIKNVASSSYSNHSASFERTTYISKVGIYDEKDNLIMVASLAKPVRKRENDEYTFKLTYDI